MLRAQIDNDRDSVGGSGIPEVTFRPLPFAEHRTFAKRSHVKDRKGFDMTYFGSTRVVDQASAHSLPRVFTVAVRLSIRVCRPVRRAQGADRTSSWTSERGTAAFVAKAASVGGLFHSPRHTKKTAPA